MTLDAVVFDLDGVLVDSETVWDGARRAVVAETGGTWRDGATRAMMGMSSHEWSRYLHDELGVPLAPQEISDRVVGHMIRAYEQHLPLLPGAVLGRPATRRTVAARRRVVGEPAGHRRGAARRRPHRLLHGDRVRRRGRPRKAGTGCRISRRHGSSASSHAAPPASRTPATACGRPPLRACSSSRCRTGVPARSRRARARGARARLARRAHVLWRARTSRSIAPISRPRATQRRGISISGRPLSEAGPRSSGLTGGENR